MIRIILVAVAFVGALVALLVWISSPANERLKTQNKLIDGGADSLGKRTGGRSPIGANRPRKATHVLVEIAYPADDPRAAQGGPVLASLRGNGVTYRRKSVSDASLERHRVPVRAVDEALAAAAQFPKTATEGGFKITIDVGKGQQVMTVPVAEAVRLLGLMKGLVDPWTPRAINLRCKRAPGVPADGVAPWPPMSALGTPQQYERTETLRAPSDVIKTLLRALKGNNRFAFEGAVYRVVSWEPVNPS